MIRNRHNMIIAKEVMKHRDPIATGSSYAADDVSSLPLCHEAAALALLNLLLLLPTM